MRDLLFAVIVVAFFAIATVLVKACDRLVDDGRESKPEAEHDPR
jgi:hypothetical protein